MGHFDQGQGHQACRNCRFALVAWVQTRTASDLLIRHGTALTFGAHIQPMLGNGMSLLPLLKLVATGCHRNRFGEGYVLRCNSGNMEGYVLHHRKVILKSISQAPSAAIVTPLNVLAISSTIFRLCHRHFKRQLWWDDHWAAMAVLLEILFTITPFLRTVFACGCILWLLSAATFAEQFPQTRHRRKSYKLQSSGCQRCCFPS